jgi:hypothetical protein
LTAQAAPRLLVMDIGAIYIVQGVAACAQG